MTNSQQFIWDDDQRQRKGRRRRNKLVLLLLLGLTLVVIGVNYFISGRAAVKRARLSEVMYMIDSKQDLLIKDSAVIKAIALDSLNFINQIEQPASSILVDTAAFFARLTELQDNKLAEIRQFKANFNSGLASTVQLGITSKSFIPLKFLTGERGGRLPAAELAFLASHCSNAAQYPFLKFAGRQLDPSVRQLDIRMFGVNSSTIDQTPYIICWAIAAAKAFDINYQIRHPQQNIVSSQQEIIDCSKGGDSNGGSSYLVFKWMDAPSVLLADSSAYSFTGKFLQSCRQPATGHGLKDWSMISCETPGDTASIKKIKDAICRFGSVVSSVNTTPGWLMYKRVEGNVWRDSNRYKESDGSFSSNHSVLIIGWDDDKQAWLIKNSWGEGWGITGGTGTQSGYMWLDYKSCNIGLKACWVVAR
ncbi:hypothetical protein D3H65_06200 [Paraflavitalea soli]|uniref:Peptidase C1A papain C-terminal domain-containing protein n=1 Tax=Paraflavitalea soli TaxID=2315862 RepID=A0A3B7MJ25_9BACT|nr:C1 family peptidase [Paraflavitalea soli]AXY73597.1 hypothetical protein D3H65_06200 [Paraflavitalea soli]